MNVILQVDSSPGAKRKHAGLKNGGGLGVNGSSPGSISGATVSVQRGITRMIIAQQGTAQQAESQVSAQRHLCTMAVERGGKLKLSCHAKGERGKGFPGNCASVSEDEDLIQAWGSW